MLRRTVDIARLPDSLTYMERVWWAPWRTCRRYAAFTSRQVGSLTVPQLQWLAEWITAEFDRHYADPNLPDTPEVTARCAELAELTWTVNTELVRRAHLAGEDPSRVAANAWLPAT